MKEGPENIIKKLERQTVMHGRLIAAADKVLDSITAGNPVLVEKILTPALRQEFTRELLDSREVLKAGSESQTVDAVCDVLERVCHNHIRDEKLLRQFVNVFKTMLIAASLD